MENRCHLIRGAHAESGLRKHLGRCGWDVIRYNFKSLKIQVDVLASAPDGRGEYVFECKTLSCIHFSNFRVKKSQKIRLIRACGQLSEGRESSVGLVFAFYVSQPRQFLFYDAEGEEFYL